MVYGRLGFMPIDTDAIRAARERAGLTQEQAAEKSGLSSKQAWNRIECGRQTDITLSTLEAIARALGVKARDLLK